MHWTRHNLEHSKLHLLTSDRPIVMPFGLADQRAYIALPVSPSVLFVAAHDQHAFTRRFCRKHTEVVKKINKSVVCQARQFVWATYASRAGIRPPLHRHRSRSGSSSPKSRRTNP